MMTGKMNRKVEGRGGKELCYDFTIMFQVGSNTRKRLVADILGGLGALMTSKHPSEPHSAILLINILRELDSCSRKVSGRGQERKQ